MYTYKKAGDLIKKESSTPVTEYRKLSLLEKNWDKLVGTPLAERTAPVACSFTDEGMKVTINVEDRGLLQAIKFRTPVLIKVLRTYFSRQDITVEIKAGKIIKQSTAKAPLPAHLRRAPVLYSDEILKLETERLISENGLEEEIAESLAKLKLTSEKLKSRKK